MRSDIRTLVEQVLGKGYLMSLATVDEGGVWVADVIYVFDDDFNVYWMSKPYRRHSLALEKNQKIAGTITVSGPREYNLGIQFQGKGEKIEGKRRDLAIKHLSKRGKPIPGEEDDVLLGSFWYKLKPTSIELIHEELFGFDKQKLIL